MACSLIFFVHFIFLSPVYSQTYLDVTSQLGIEHSYGQDAFGGGVSFYDFDQDGWDDISFATMQGDSVVFYKNMGGYFQEVYFQGVHHAGHVKQILWCDYDNDGDKDLFIAGRSWDNFIYINDGNFHFSPYLIPAPAPIFTGDTYGATFGDIDLDGDLDLFICNHIESIALPNQLFLNNGDGTMTDITQSLFFDSLYQLTFSAAFLDYNNDMLPDLYTAEDRFGVNQIYENMGGGHFQDECDGCGAEIVINAMSVSPGDYDNDGDLDIYISNTQQGNALLRNNGNETFTDVALEAGVTYGLVAWGATFFDYDHDKDMDLYVSGSTNGETMKNRLYDNLGDGSFQEATYAGFIGDSTRSFSHAIGDINNDGYYDIAVLNIDPDNSQLWQSSGGMNNWIKIELEGTISNREGIGSWIEVWSEGEKQVIYTNSGEGYLAQNSGYEIVGLGSANKVDSILVRWLSGIVDRLTDVPVNQVISIIEGSTGVTSLPGMSFMAATIYPNPFDSYIVIKSEPISNVDLIFHDLQGKFMFSLKTDLSGYTQIPMEFLEKGIYLLTLQAGEQLISRKVIKY